VKLLLFDIDGTLILSGGAGRVAMERAFDTVYARKDGFRDVSMMGRTDPAILREALERFGVPWKEPEVEKFREYYFWFLEEELEVQRPGKGICPGVLPLLSAIQEKRDLMLGLLTGNWRYGAHLKLRHFGIDSLFETGAFADDSENRDALVPVAMERIARTSGNRIAKEAVFVIGDTPHDIRCAKPHGVRTVAVATGIHTMDELSAERPDFLFPNLLQTDSVLRVFES
jgi:phosphoglycolate phosphatase-like HAD superfamily hydrolase